MEWNFFRRNRERKNNNKGYVGRTEVFRSGYDGVPEKGTTEEPKEATVADTEVKSDLGEIQGGYPSENPVDREWFNEKQQRAVNALGEDPHSGRISEDLPESSFEGIQGGYSSENPVDREWFYGEQQRAVNGLGEDQSVTRARESAARSSRANRYTELGGPEDFVTFTAYLNGDLTDEQLQSIVEAKKASEHQRG